jgi:hypothetical protein
MWLTLFKALLIAWLAIGLTVMVIMGVRRSRANRGDPGTLGRPRRVGHKSANISSGNSSSRCAARNAKTLSVFRR